MRIFTARKPAATAASAASACSSGPRISPNDAYAGRPLAAPPNSTDTGSPDALPMMSQSAASSGQYRPAWKLIVSSTATCARDPQRVAADEQRRERLEAVHGVARAVPVTPSSVSTRTSVASKWRRGTGSQAARNGGSSGSRSRSSRIAVIFTAARAGAAARDAARRSPGQRGVSAPGYGRLADEALGR